MLYTDLDDPEWSSRVVDIQVVDEPREGDREEVGALPETAKLLVLHRTAHLELTAYTGGVAGGVVSKSSPDHLACGGIPELACLVSRGSQ